MNSKVLGVSIGAVVCLMLVVLTVFQAVKDETKSFDITESTEVDVEEIDGKLVFNDVNKELEAYGDSLKLELEEALREGDDDTVVSLLTFYNRFAFESVMLMYRQCYDSLKMSLDEDTETLNGLYSSMLSSVESQNSELIGENNRFTEPVRNKLREVYGQKGVTNITFDENVFYEISDYSTSFQPKEYCQMLQDTGYALALAASLGDERIGSIVTE